MAVLRIRKYGEHILRKKTSRIDYQSIRGSLPRLLSDMCESMESVQGVGLAAPQIGFSLRLAIVDIKPEGESRRIVLINPELIGSSGTSEESEGCLSLPGFFVKLKRHLRVKIRALNEAGAPMELAGEGLLARALQHEIDHLDGKLIIDRLPLYQRIKARYVLRKLRRTWI